MGHELGMLTAVTNQLHNNALTVQVWHPNVSSANGAICLDILKDQWSPALTLKTALLSLQALLSSPEPADPQVRSIHTCLHLFCAFACHSYHASSACSEKVCMIVLDLSRNIPHSLYFLVDTTE